MSKINKPKFEEKLIQPSIHLYPIQLKAKAVMRTSNLTSKDIQDLRDVYKYTFDHFDRVTDRDKKILLNLRKVILEYMEWQKQNNPDYENIQKDKS